MSMCKFFCLTHGRRGVRNPGPVN